MNRLLSLALIAALLGGVMLSAPAQAGMIAVDLPNLTWPEGTVLPPSDGGVVLGTKSPSKG